MGLTFKKDDELEKTLDSFAILPDDKTKPDKTAKKDSEKAIKDSKKDKKN